MCGILLVLSQEEPSEPSSDVLLTLKARGPDSLASIRRTYDRRDSGHSSCASTTWHLSFISSVLNLRGSQIQTQPLLDNETGSVFCWNGEAWKIDDVSVSGNDSSAVFSLLTLALANAASYEEEPQKRSEQIARALTSIAGPYAFVFYDAQAGQIFYGRDRLGRRSLMFDTTEDDRIQYPRHPTYTISSFDTTATGTAIEVSTRGIHCLDLNTAQMVHNVVAWTEETPTINKQLPSSPLSIERLPSLANVDALRRHMNAAIRLRVLDVPTFNLNVTACSEPSRVAVLFSGGIDCTLIARMCHNVLPLNEPIDLLNVAFENPRTIRAAAAAAAANTTTGPASTTSFYENCPDRITGRASFSELVRVCPRRLWRFVAVNVPYVEAQEHRSTIVRLMRPQNTEMDLSIAMALYFAARGHGTASTTSDDELTVPYTTTARVLLSGLGADELFGGYSRHAAAFSRGEFAALNEELELDFMRIGTRNLGRDDRVLAHWSREVRYPFLDEDFVRFSLNLPAWEKLGFRPGVKIAKHFEDIASANPAMQMEDLDPSKMILRCLLWQLDMPRAAGERKRAIQFGSRTAKMEAGRTKGTDLLK